MGDQVTNRDKVISTLVTSGPMCDDCLSSSSTVKPRQTVNIQCRELQQHGELKRHKDMCPQCKQVKIVNRLQTGAKRSENNKETGEVIRVPLREIKRPEYSEGQFPAGEMEKVVANLAQQIGGGSLEIYNEFSLQHELGILLRNTLPK